MKNATFTASGLMAAGLLFAGSALFSSVNASPDTQTPAAPAEPVTAETGLSAWAKIYEVFSHPRCANCHVEDGRPMWSGPSYGETRVHGMYVGGDADLLMGNPGMFCMTCHMPENSTKLHGPPGAEVWHLPPKEMVWHAKASHEICVQVKDPVRNGGRSLAEIEHHVAEDALVAWGWAPGPGRQPAPYSAKETAQFVAAWAAAGAPCPEPEAN